MEYTEQAIIQGLKQGDRQVFSWLFREYYAPLCLYAHRFTATREPAEEIVAATFAAVWEKRAVLQLDTSVKAYLFRTVHNRGLNYLKQLKSRKRYEDYLLEQAPVWTGGGEQEQRLTGETLRQDIDRALQDLPGRCREIFLLSRLEGKKYHEIAAALNLSTKTVETQMSIALRRLRASLRHWLPLLLLLLK